MNKKFIAFIIAILIVGFAVFYDGLEDGRDNNDLTSLVECLAENELVIYGSEYCSACSQLVESLGGKQTVEPVYVECADNKEKCKTNKETNYVPEIQINGEVYQGDYSPQSLAKEVGCEF